MNAHEWQLCETRGDVVQRVSQNPMYPKEEKGYFRIRFKTIAVKMTARPFPSETVQLKMDAPMNIPT